MATAEVEEIKPTKTKNNKKIRLYATDIILLGSLTDNNLWGIPNNISELVSSTYQLPPNLALTDSDLEGNYYIIKKATVWQLLFNYNKFILIALGPLSPSLTPAT